MAVVRGGVSPPRIVHGGGDAYRSRGTVIGDRVVLTAIITALALTPLTPWATYPGGAVSVIGLDAGTYGRFNALLALACLVVLHLSSGKELNARGRAVMAFLGACALLATLMDYLLMALDQEGSPPTSFCMAPGTGMYLSMAVSLGLVIVPLLGFRGAGRRPRTKVPALRPGSRG